MKKKIPWRFVLVILVFLLVYYGAYFAINYQRCYCPDGTKSLQKNKDADGNKKPCDCDYYTSWCDETTDLCWQSPQREAYNYDDIGVISKDAIRYCEDLVIDGYDDWRLPNIDELRSLVRGNPDTMSEGDCPITEGSGTDDYDNATCKGAAAHHEGPGTGGCYWPPGLEGTCDKPDPFALGHPLEYWSTNPADNDPEHWITFVSFESGTTGFNHVHSFGDVRCVRSAPSPDIPCEENFSECEPGKTRECNCSDTRNGAQVCNDEGSCFGPCDCTGFVPTPPRDDVSDQCDKLKLTIKVPEKLKGNPYQLIAFFYHPDKFPPGGPPCGGTDENQIEYPDIDIDKPYVMTVPGCTYYRENCLTGPYHLYAALMMNKTLMPIPKTGDFTWGLDQGPITLGSGKMLNIEKEITLVAVE
jgi:hypothetical protein